VSAARITLGEVLRAAGALALAYAVIGVVVTVVLSLLGGGDVDVAAAIVLAVALACAAVFVVVLARLAVGWLADKVSEPVTHAVMVASGLVLLSGVMSVRSLGLWSLGVSAVMAAATHVVLTRRWG